MVYSKCLVRNRSFLERLGRVVEVVVAVVMSCLGAELLSYRYRTPVGELDLIFLSHNEIVFVEVKSSVFACGDDVWFSRVNGSRIVSAANYFFSDHGSDFAGMDVRFDLFFVPLYGRVVYYKGVIL